MYFGYMYCRYDIGIGISSTRASDLVDSKKVAFEQLSISGTRLADVSALRTLHGCNSRDRLRHCHSVRCVSVALAMPGTK